MTYRAIKPELTKELVLDTDLIYLTQGHKSMIEGVRINALLSNMPEKAAMFPTLGKDISRRVLHSLKLLGIIAEKIEGK